MKILAAILLLPALFPGRPIRAKETPGFSPAIRTYDTHSFIEELGRLKAGLENAGKSADTLRTYRESLPESWIVESGGRHYQVPADLLASRLLKAATQPELRKQQLGQARDYLDALAAETAALSGTPPSDTSSAKAALDKILARPEYSHNKQLSWWDRFRAQINQMIFDALSRIFRGIGGQKSLGQVLLWLGICAAAILIAYALFRRWFRAARLEEMALESAAIPARSWQQWIFAARAAADRGDYRLAIHCAYWAGISRLQDLGTVPPDRAKTPREYLRSLAKSKLILPETYAARYQALSAMTSRLETTWYGYHAATEADFRDSLAQLEILGCHLV